MEQDKKRFEPSEEDKNICKNCDQIFFHCECESVKLVEQEPKEEQISERRLKLITSREYWKECISAEMWNRRFGSVRKCDIEADKIVSNHFMTRIGELAERIGELEEENKAKEVLLNATAKAYDKMFAANLELRDENERLKGKVKEARGKEHEVICSDGLRLRVMSMADFESVFGKEETDF